MLVFLAIPAWAAVGDPLETFEQGPLFTDHRWVEVTADGPDTTPLPPWPVDVRRFERARTEPWPGQATLELVVARDGRVRGATLTVLASFAEDPRTSAIVTSYVDGLGRSSGVDVVKAEDGDTVSWTAHLDDRPTVGWEALLPSAPEGWVRLSTDPNDGYAFNGWAPFVTAWWRRPDGSLVFERLTHESSEAAAEEQVVHGAESVVRRVGRYVVAVQQIRVTVADPPTGHSTPAPPDPEVRAFAERAVAACATAVGTQ